MKDDIPSTVGQGTTIFPSSVTDSSVSGSSNSNNNHTNRGGRGYYRGGRGGRGRGGRGRFGGRGGRGFSHSGTKRKFKGETADLNDNIFETPEENSDAVQFTRTVEAIERYAKKTYSSIKFKDLFTKFNNPTLAQPKDIKKDATATEKRLHDLRLQRFVKKEEDFEASLEALFAVIWGQCSDHMVTKLRAVKKIDEMKDNGECGSLLKEIRKICTSYESQKNPYLMTVEGLRDLINHKQDERTSVRDYYEAFKMKLDNFKRFGADLGQYTVLCKKMMEDSGVEYDTATSSQKAAYMTLAKEKLEATMLIMGSDKKRYSSLLLDLENSYTTGYDKFPESLSEAYTLMTNYKSSFIRPRNNYSRTTNGKQEQDQYVPNVAFTLNSKSRYSASKSNPVAGIDGTIDENFVCYRCNKCGHKSFNCPTVLTNTCTTVPSGNEAKSSSESNEDRSQKTGDDNVVLTQLGSSTKETDKDGDFWIFTQYAHTMTQSRAKHSGLGEGWILLDSQSNCDIFRDKYFLTNLHSDPEHKLSIQSNGGEMCTDVKGYLTNYGEVWYHPASLANILSLANVRKKFKVTLETGPSDKKPTIKVHCDNNIVIDFVEHKCGLYVHQIKRTSDIKGHALVQTVKENESNFTNKEIKKAQAARDLYKKLGRPGYKQFFSILQNNQIIDCDVTVTDAKRSIKIYGKDIGIIKGKTVRRKPKSVTSPDLVPLPPQIRNWHRNIILCIDICFACGMPFLHTISKNLQFRTIQFLESQSYKHILSQLYTVFNLYLARGFKITWVHGDGQFECIREAIRPTLLHIAAPNQHIPQIERSIRTLKDDARSTINSLPYKKYTRLMMQTLLKRHIELRNIFPAPNGISNVMSPTTIMTGQPIPNIQQFQLEYGTYVQAHEHPTITNGMDGRAVGAIALHPSNNNDGWCFLSLYSGKKITRFGWTIIPITNEVINRVEQLASSEGMPALAEKYIFEWKPGDPILPIDNNDDHDDDVSIEGAEDEEQEQPNVTTHEAIEQYNQSQNEDTNYYSILDNQEENEEQLGATEDTADFPPTTEIPPANEITEENPQFEVEADPSTEDNIHSEVENMEADEAQRSVDGDEVENQRSETEEADASQSSDSESDSEINQSVIEDELREENAENAVEQSQANNEKERVNMRYNLRSKTKSPADSSFNRKHFLYDAIKNKKKYKRDPPANHRREIINSVNLLQKGKKCDMRKLQQSVIGLCMTQMHASKGIKLLGDRALSAMAKEYEQLDNLDVFEPQWPKQLTNDTKKSSLRAIDLIKIKRSGKIKGRTVADGSVQRGSISKEESTSPAAHYDSLIASTVIDAMEERDIATCDIAGAYLKAKMDDFVVIRITGHAVESLLKVNKKKYQQYVTYESGKKVLYLKLLKAMYGCLKAAILWYKLFAGTLKDNGFKTNPYEPCVANKVVEGSQLTILWYVDDVKISHKSEKVVSDTIKMLEGHFGKMTVKRGKDHEYLGMQIEIKDRKVHIKMDEYLRECLKDFGEAINGSAKTPATKDIFVVNEKEQKLDEEKKKKFHSITAKLLYISKRARLDLQYAVGYLTTRVQNPTMSDWRKLRRVLQYVNGTIDMVRILSLNQLMELDILVDAAYATHPDMKSHTGGCIRAGDGVLHSRSSKQRLNTKSSTEAELVGVSEYLPFAVWILYFLKEQGYTLKTKKLMQDNQSTIKLLKNGKKSAGKQSRHIDIRFFWTADRLKAHDIEVEYCPTECMLGDFFTKPLQGSLFRDMRDVIMGHKHSDILDPYFNHSKSIAFDRKERVAEKEINEGTKLDINKKWRKNKYNKNIAVSNVGDRHYIDVETNNKRVKKVKFNVNYEKKNKEKNEK